MSMSHLELLAAPAGLHTPAAAHRVRRERHEGRSGRNARRGWRGRKGKDDTLPKAAAIRGPETRHRSNRLKATEVLPERLHLYVNMQLRPLVPPWSPWQQPACCSQILFNILSASLSIQLVCFLSASPSMLLLGLARLLCFSSNARS